VLERERLPAPGKGAGVWKRRYREINGWERYLVNNGIRVVKLFLNVSREEQRTRFLKRIDLAEKNWTFSAADVAEREYWDDYKKAFSEMLGQGEARGRGSRRRRRPVRERTGAPAAVGREPSPTTTSPSTIRVDRSVGAASAHLCAADAGGR
jgi:hypothetical protein